MEKIPNPFDGDINDNAILDWLEQFDEEDQPVIIKLLSNFKYFSSKKVSDLAKSLYETISNTLDIATDRLWFIPVGYVAKSGSIIAYYFRTQNDLPQDRFIAPADISSLPLDKGDVVVFLDDFVGSGNQACQVWQNVVLPVKDSSRCQFAYAVLAGYQQGFEEIRKSTGFRTFSVEVLTEEDQPFSSSSSIFKDAREKTHAKTIIEKYGKQLYPNHPLGFRESQGLIGFFYSTPNNSLPIFWSTASGWKPILAHGESYRDPAFLIGPPPGLVRESISTSPRKALVDLEELDRHEIDPAMATTIFSEFRKVSIFLALASVLRELGISDEVLVKMVALISQLKHLQHEKESVRSAMMIIPKGIPERLIGTKMLSVGTGVSLDSTAEVLGLANLIDGFQGSVVFRPDGRALGNFLYSDAPYTGDTFLPKAYHLPSAASASSSGLLFLFDGEGRVSVFYKGQRILSHRSATWHLHTTELERGIRDLSKKHQIDVPVLQHIFRIALRLSYEGKGALITVGDHESIIGISDPPKTEHIEWVDMQLGESRDEAILGLMSQDGATIISGNGQILQGMTFLRPPAGTEAEEEVGRGSKHSTASKISKVTKAVCIAVSVDGRITVYSDGSIAFKIMG